jgi:hypothetical protein
MDEAGVAVPIAVEEVITPEHLVTWVINETEEVTENSVSVTFTCGTTEITHDRTVNTIGCEDASAIEQRLSEVARGVHNKILVGAISEPTPEVIEEL